jgi:glycosyltransferase involved in cell wall biosynthesis
LFNDTTESDSAARGEVAHLMDKALDPAFSVVIPCYNEHAAIRGTVDQIERAIPADRPYEIIVVNDGSTDQSEAVLASMAVSHPHVRVLAHRRNRGYGAALKTGIRNARAELIAITDADGTYPNDKINELVDLCAGYDMVVGARTSEDVTYSKIRSIPKFFLRIWISYLAGFTVPDINSGLRVFRKSVAERFFGVLSDRFSFTITITLAMLTNYRPTLFVPISYHARIGKSKLRPIRDTLRFTMLILRTGTYFAPARAFAPIFVSLFIGALASLVYDLFVLRNLTDKTVLLFLFSMNIAMFALLADMIDKRIG